MIISDTEKNLPSLDLAALPAGWAGWTHFRRWSWVRDESGLTVDGRKLDALEALEVMRAAGVWPDLGAGRWGFRPQPGSDEPGRDESGGDRQSADCRRRLDGGRADRLAKYY